jgi:RNA polymerase sigma-70 factor (ECF subfamily)
MTDFENLYKEFQPRILRYLGMMTEKSEAPDLTQVVFMKVGKGLKDFRGESSLSTWIYRIATNTAFDHNKYGRAAKELEQLGDEGSSMDDFPADEYDGPEKEFIVQEMNACIRGVVEQLPENYRVVLVLSEFEGLTNPEIAEVLNLSIDTVKIRLHRARAALRKALESECCFYHDERNEMMCDRKQK